MSEQTKRKPKYLWLKEQLSALLQEQAEGQEICLPSERELCDHYNVSRITVRRALEELDTSGLIVRVQGKGAFLRPTKYTSPLSSLTSFTEDMDKHNVRCSSHILALENILASDKVAEALRVREGTPIVMLKRLRLANGTPLAIETAYIPQKIGEIVKQYIMDDVSLYDIFRSKCDTTPAFAEQRMEIGLLKPWEQSLLGDGAPIYAMCTTRLDFDKNQVPLEYVEGKYRGDRYSYHVTMTNESFQGSHCTKSTQSDL